jgi:hypothetical protein
MRPVLMGRGVDIQSKVNHQNLQKLQVMTVKKAISNLNYYQAWRLGAEMPMIEPKELTKSIDVILSLFAKIDEKIEEQNKEKDEFYDFINSLPSNTSILAVNEFGQPTSINYDTN